jgi:glycosyltransferase involved in cell wall biosynthesis
MKLFFIADGRSPIARQWIKHWIDRGEDVYLASTFSCVPLDGLKGFCLTPVAFSAAKSGAASKSLLWSASTLKLRSVIRQWLGPLTLPRAAGALRAFIEQVQPDLVHALRIPYEGMLAAQAAPAAPLLLSVWGNDFTLHARSSPLMAFFTRRALARAQALHADCARDIRLARGYGWRADLPTLVIPGNGGLDASIFYPPAAPVAAPIVINPRGFRAYVRNDTFFRAIPLVLKEMPQARFLCASMAGEPQAEAYLRDLGIESAVTLLPPTPHAQMGEIFRGAAVLVSPSTHDGTPNSLIEGMACGCFPIAGDLESIREWITPEQNGLLINPASETELANAILRALNDSALREKAAQINASLLAERAEFTRGMEKAAEFYQQVKNQPKESEIRSATSHSRAG